jgi:hypothetical protein
MSWVLVRQRPATLEVVVGGDGKAGFDDVDAQLRELLGEGDLLLDVHGEAGGLFAVSQGGVENDDAAHKTHPLTGPEPASGKRPGRTPASGFPP